MTLHKNLLKTRNDTQRALYQIDFNYYNALNVYPTVKGGFAINITLSNNH